MNYSTPTDRQRMIFRDGVSVKELTKPEKDAYHNCLADGFCIGAFCKKPGTGFDYKVRVKTFRQVMDEDS